MSRTLQLVVSMTSRWRILVLAAAGLLCSCGFQPVYMPTASGRPGPAQRNLAAIHVDVIADRPGQLLRQALQERFGSDSGATPQRYDLTVAYSISGENIGITGGDIATRIRLIANASWKLTAADTAKTLMTNGAARAADAVNVQDQQYFAADLENEQAARRLAAAVANQITMQLATFFRRPIAVAGRAPR